MRLPASLLHALAFSACCNGAAGTPALTGEDFAKVATLAAEILTEQHFSRRSPDDALSHQWLRSYFERVDPGRKWFLQKDVADLEKRFGTVLDDALLAGDAAPATALYAKLLDRVRERRKRIDGFLRDEGADTFAFLGNATAPRPGTIKNWASDRAAADEVWRRRVLAEVLAVKLQEDTTLAAARDRVRERYRRQVERLIAVDSGPLAVLVDAQTAGAAEHVAGALQDYGRALVVGDSSTSGQGLLQAFEPLRGKEFRQRAGALRITIGKFYRPTGRAIQSMGVDPHVLQPWGNPSLSRKSAQYNPLPYDEIRAHPDFKATARPKLRVHPGKNNPDRATLQNKLAEMRSRTELSLNEERRRTEMTQIDEMLARLDELAAERPIVTIKKHLTVSQKGDVIETIPAAEASSGWIRSQEGVRAAAQILLATETSQP